MSKCTQAACLQFEVASRRDDIPSYKIIVCARQRQRKAVPVAGNLKDLQLRGQSWTSPDIPHLWSQATTLTSLSFSECTLMSLSELQKLRMIKSLTFTSR